MSPPKAVLCQYCSTEVFGPAGWARVWAAERESGKLKVSYMRLYVDTAASAESKCWFCSKLTYEFDHYRHEHAIEHQAVLANQNSLCEVIVYFRNKSWQLLPSKISSAEIRVVFHSDTPGVPTGPYHLFDIGITAVPESPASTIFLAPQLIRGKYTNFDPQIAMRCLRECQTNHPHCTYKPSPRLPKRVLDCRLNAQICLIETNVDQGADYAALSYAWGGPQPLRTLASNIAQRLAGCSLGSLPRTLRDAIQVTRELGLRYLWIDSICIIQDSVEDVIEELRRMSDYYRNAFCVIAASRAKASTEGFLDLAADTTTMSDFPGGHNNEIGGKDARSVEIASFGPHGTEDLLVLEDRPTHYYPDDDPLSQRAWTLQEHLLCPRVLRFPYPGGFAMQCEEGEHFHGKIYYEYYEHKRLLRRSPQKLDADSLDPTTSDVHESWLNVLGNYGQMLLSNPEDKLTAIASLAEEYSRRNPELGRYLAGHWETFLTKSLVWSVYRAKPRPPRYRAPSWAWPSVHNAMHDNYFNRKRYRTVQTMFQILACQATPMQESLRFGSVASGYLRVRARLQVITEIECGSYTGADSLKLPNRDRMRAVISWDALDEKPRPYEETYIMRLESEVHEPHVPSSPNRPECVQMVVHCLILRKHQPDRFRRIAYFRQRSEEPDIFLTEETEFYLD